MKTITLKKVSGMGGLELLLYGNGTDPFDWKTSSLHLEEGDILHYKYHDYIVNGKMAYRDSGWDRCIFYLSDGIKHFWLMEELFDNKRLMFLEPFSIRIYGELNYQISIEEGHYYCRQRGIARIAKESDFTSYDDRPMMYCLYQLDHGDHVIWIQQSPGKNYSIFKGIKIQQEQIEMIRGKRNNPESFRMAIWKRLCDMTTAMLNRLLDKAEDPVKMLTQYLLDMERDITDVEVAVAKQIKFEKRCKQQYEEALVMVQKRQEQSIKALELGNEDLARRALQDKKEYERRITELKVQYDNTKLHPDQLRNQLRDMKEDFIKMKNKNDTLMARVETAKTQKKINQVSFRRRSGRR
jgi:phage shock protein A